MSRTLPNRDVSPLIKFFRELVRGKPMQHNALRHADKVASRSQPQPDLPGGPYAKTTQIYYYARDGRREVAPPTVVITSKQLESGKPVSELKGLAPGKIYQPE